MKKKSIKNNQILIYYSKYKIRIVITIIMMVVISILSLMIPIMTGLVIDDGILLMNNRNVIKYSITLLFIILIKALLDLINTYQINMISNKVKLDIHEKSFKKLEEIKIEYFNLISTTQIYSDLDVDINNITRFVDTTLYNLLSLVFTFIGGICLIFLISPVLSMIVLAYIPIKLLLSRYFSKKIRQKSLEVINSKSGYAKWFNDTVNSIRDLRNYNLYDEMETQSSQIRGNLFNKALKNTMILSYKNNIEIFIQHFLNTILYLVGALLIFKGTLSLGLLISFISYVLYVITPVSSITDIKFALASVSPSFDRLNKFFHEESEYICKSMDFYDDKTEFNHVEFKDVSFAYKDKIILDNINFTINKGDIVQIEGVNGSGKSTLIDLMLKFYDPVKGNIYLNGHDYKKLPVNYIRRFFGISSQKSSIFNNSIKYNILLNQYEDFTNVTKRVIKDIFKDLNLFNTVNNDNVSSGEKQKILLARMLQKNADICIFDESLNNLDMNSKSILKGLIEEISKDKTIIMISHNDELPIVANKKLILKNNSVVLKGA